MNATAEIIDQPQGADSGQGQGLIAVIASGLAIGSLLLPVVGAVSRSVSFTASGLVPASLATAAPIGQLAEIGFWAVLPLSGIAVLFLAFRCFVAIRHSLDSVAPDLAELKSIVEDWRAKVDLGKRGLDRDVAALTALGARLEAADRGDYDQALSPEAQSLAAQIDEAVESLRASSDVFKAETEAAFARFEEKDAVVAGGLARTEAMFPRWQRAVLRRVPGWVLNLAGALVLAGMLVLTPGFPAAALTVTLSLSVSLWLWREMVTPRRTLGVGDVWPAIVLLIIAFAVASGLRSSPGQPVEFSLTAEAGIPSGCYVQVGAEGGFTYLLTCEATHELYAVPAALVRNARLGPPNRAEPLPSLWEIWTAGKQLKLGFVTGC